MSHQMLSLEKLPIASRQSVREYFGSGLRPDIAALAITALAFYAAAALPGGGWFVAAFAINVWFLGRIRALVLTLGAAFLLFSIAPPSGASSFPVSILHDPPHVLVYIAVVVLVGAATGVARSSRKEAERHAFETRRLNADLEFQVEEVRSLSENLTEANEALARVYDKEREARQSAELVSQAREEVLGVVAHDLRSPLNLVGMTSEMLMDTTLEPERRNSFYEINRRAVRRMNRLIGDLLDVVRLEAGHLSLNLAACDVSAVLAETIESFGSRAAEAQIALELACSPKVVLRADGERVLQLIDNLVSNALKFTPRGGRVTVGGYVGPDELRIAVGDTGPGIPREQCDRLFDRFWQAQGSDRRGLGLGLAIAKGIAEAHGGRIWVDSTVGSGSTFQFTLPLIKELPAS